jgi:predicted enzyme related to lactoylglutathione lyase
MKFKGICLMTTDVPRLAAFYSRVFGVEPEGDAVHSALTLGDAGLALYHPEELEQAARSEGNKRFTLMFEVEDVDAAYERLREFVTDFTLLPTTQPWGSRAVHFNDPDGNNVDLYSVVKR